MYWFNNTYNIKLTVFLNYLFVSGCAGFLLLMGFSLVAAHGGYSLVEVQVPLFAVASQGAQAGGDTSFSSCSPWMPELRLSCSVACGVFLDQGLNLCLLHGQVDSFH